MQIGQAILDRKLGQGGMAEVWLGHNAVLDTPVAVKFLISPWAGHPDLEQRFLNEAKRQGALDHPNIVKAYGFEYVEGHSFLIMQYIDGESLDDKMIRGGRRPLASGDILCIARGALTGLEHAHKHQVVHRDIKPSNIMIDRSAHVYISDFGLALVRDEQRVTRTGTLMGTPLYMSPEQILRPREVDHRADIYSFGCVLYEMFTGRAPFETEEDGTDFNVKMAHATLAPPPLRQFNSAVPPEVEAVVMKCLEKNPDHRFATCGELREALAKVMPDAAPAKAPPSREDFQRLFEDPALVSSPTPASLPPPPPRITPAPLLPPVYPPAPPQHRTPPMPLAALIGGAVLLAASLGGATYYVTRHYLAVKPKTDQSRGPELRDDPLSDHSRRMPQPDSKAGTLRNHQVPQPRSEPIEPKPVEPKPVEPKPIEPPKPQAPWLELAAQPLNNVKFRVRLRSKISSETSEEGQTITAPVLAPASCSGCTMIGVVRKAGRSGFIPGMRKAELLFNFHTLRFPDGQLRAIHSRIVGFKNSRGEADKDEEEQKVDAAQAAKKIFISAAAGTVIGAITRRNKEGALQGTAAGAQVGVLLTGFTAKGKSMSFAPGSIFELNVSDRME